MTDDLQEHLVVTNLAGAAVASSSRSSSSRTSPTSSRSSSTTSRSAIPRAPARCPPAVALVRRRDADDRPSARSGGRPLDRRPQLARSTRLGLGARASRSQLGPHAEWDVRLSFRPQTGRVRPGRTPRARHFGEQRDRIRRSLDAWNLHVPQLNSSWGDLGQAYARSVADLAVAAHARQRRHRAAARGGHAVVHDGVRARHDDHVPADARLRARARAHRVARARRAAGRRRRAGHRRRARQDHPRAAPRARRRGLVPALLRHGRRDAALPRAALRDLALDARRCPRARARARAAMALRWIDESGDCDGDGFVEFLPPLRPRPRGAVLEGLARLPAFRRRPRRRAARSPPARCRATSTTRSCARPSWRAQCSATPRSPSGSSARRPSCASASIARSGSIATAASTHSRSTARSGRSTAAAPTWAICSGAGSCPRRASPTSLARCLDEPLWSGWGVRTMSAADEAYRPLAYHRGTVWPHDNSLIAHGLALRGETEASLQILRSLLEAARFFDGGLPEVFAGLARRDTPFPVAYPTASRPQAWAAGASGAAAARPARPRARSRGARR